VKKKEQRPAQALRGRYDRFKRQLAKVGWVLQGTITERFDRRQDTKAGRKKKTYGPYYQWTFKRHGKTVTVNLTPSQAKTYQKAIDNHRKMQRTINKMRSLSLEFLETTTKGVNKRKARQNTDLSLS